MKEAGVSQSEYEDLVREHLHAPASQTHMPIVTPSKADKPDTGHDKRKRGKNTNSDKSASFLPVADPEILQGISASYGISLSLFKQHQLVAR